MNSFKVIVIALTFTGCLNARDVTGAVRALTEWPDGARLALAEHDGELVVFDFFAHWCAPCLRASRDLAELESAHRALPGGGGVAFVAVNTEPRQPERTRRFIERTGLHRVFHDPAGRLVDTLGVNTLPFICIARVERTADGLRCHVVKTFREYPGRGGLEREIGRLRGEAHEEPAPLEPAAPPVAPRTAARDIGSDAFVDAKQTEAPEVLAGHARSAGEATFEGLWTSDVAIMMESFGWSLERDGWNAGLDLSHTRFDVDYQPSSRSLVGNAAELEEHRFRLAARGGIELSETLSVLGGAGFYRGFSDHGSVWLEEHYRQRFSTFPGYDHDISPFGLSARIGARHEYIPGNAVGEISLGYQYDEISPAYERDLSGPRPLLKGLDRLHTASIGLSSENSVTRRIRARNEFRGTRTTGREWRLAYLGSLHVALAERWIVKCRLASTRESSVFRAWSADLETEIPLTERLHLSLFARHYEDDGELTDPSIPSSAAPPLRTTRIGAAIVFRGEFFRFQIAGGFYRTDYGELPPISFDFENLHRDRDWCFARCALSLRF